MLATVAAATIGVFSLPFAFMVVCVVDSVAPAAGVDIVLEPNFSVLRESGIAFFVVRFCVVSVSLEPGSLATMEGRDECKE